MLVEVRLRLDFLERRMRFLENKIEITNKSQHQENEIEKNVAGIWVSFYSNVFCFGLALLRSNSRTGWLPVAPGQCFGYATRAEALRRRKTAISGFCK